LAKYNPVTDVIIKELQTIIGEKYVLTDADKMDKYSHDEVTDPKYVKMPEVVLLPASAQEISQVIKLANREHIPIVPRGAGTGLASGAVPFKGGIVLSLERMDKILEIDTENMFMTVEPGATTEAVQQAAREKGFLYAGDPCSGDSSFIGGNVATNAGGNKAIKYGTTRQQVNGVELVTAEGDIVDLGGKTKKDSSGYNLTQLVIGSEGTLGVVTKAILKLVPLPKGVIDLLAIFPDLTTAIGIVPKLMAAGITPTSVEFMDNAAIKSCEKFLNEKLPHSDNGYYIIIQVEGDNEDLLDDQAVIIDEMCTENGALSVLVADPAKIWKARKVFAEADRALSLIFSMEDLVVPMDKIPSAIEQINSLGQKYGVSIHCAGHAADGNIHANLLKEQLSDEKWNEILPALQQELYTMVYEMGGKLSGEHGIGYKRVKLLEQFASPIELKMMRAIKKALDPNLIMNPGKVFNME